MNTPPKNNNLSQDLINLVKQYAESLEDKSREIDNLKARLDILDQQRKDTRMECPNLSVDRTELNTVNQPDVFERTLLTILNSQSILGIYKSEDNSAYQWFYRGSESELYTSVPRAVLAWMKYIATRHENF